MEHHHLNAEAVPHCDVVLSHRSNTHHTRPQTRSCPMSRQQVGLCSKRFQKVRTPLWSLNQRSILASPHKHGCPSLKNLGLVIGEDVEIAYCPERFNPGDAAHGVRQVARVIGCSNPEIGEKLVQLYSKLTTEDVRYVGKLEVAEAAKVIENVQRDINIALGQRIGSNFPRFGC